MVGVGITEENICLVVRDRRDKPISRTSLRKHFKRELETGATKLNAQVGNFMVSTIFGAKPPNGVTPIRDERVRGRLGELFLKARLGWREIGRYWSVVDLTADRPLKHGRVDVGGFGSASHSSAEFRARSARRSLLETKLRGRTELL